MTLWEWLRTHDARLDVRLSCEMDPCESEVEWHCEIRGFPSPNGVRPAVYITRYPDGPETIAEGFAPDPGRAFRSAIDGLRGLTATIIGQGRDETVAFPADLTS